MYVCIHTNTNQTITCFLNFMKSETIYDGSFDDIEYDDADIEDEDLEDEDEDADDENDAEDDDEGANVADEGEEEVQEEKESILPPPVPKVLS